jgi:hypothetical protein
LNWELPPPGAYTSPVLPSGSKFVVLLTIAAAVVLLTQCACAAHRSPMPQVEHACCTQTQTPIHSDQTPGCRHCDTSASPVPDSALLPSLDLMCVERVASADQLGACPLATADVRARPPDPVSVQARLCVLLT